jgi:hypothetical protein
MPRGLPGSSDRAWTSKYPLVSALSRVAGAPLTTSACARFTRRLGPYSPAPGPNPQVNARNASLESLFATAQVGALGTFYLEQPAKDLTDAISNAPPLTGVLADARKAAETAQSAPIPMPDIDESWVIVPSNFD